jgi:threonine/homoserine/homoserine lactone efflux protein
MPDILLPLIFVGAALLAALEPGPNFVLLADETLRRGRSSGWKAALGLHAGAWPHILLAAAGLVTLLQIVPELLTAMKWIAAAWLLWLAFQTIAGGDARGDGTAPSAPRKSAFRRGFTLVLLNPRTSLFFAGFPLLFVSHDAAFPVAAQILLFGGLVNLVFLAVDFAFVAIAGRAGAAIDLKPFQKRVLRWLGGGLLAGFALKLATERD